MDGTDGRRGNGLFSSDWGALVDLDPRLSAGLLAALEAAGVPAYVEPAASVDTVHRAVTMPSRPLDRLWVDPTRAEAARTVVSAEVADLTALLENDDRPDTDRAAAYGMVHPVPQGAARRVLPPPRLPSLQARPADRQQSDDELFAQIIAEFDRPAEDRVPRWPAAEDAGPLAPPPSRTAAPPPRPTPPPPLPSWVEPDALEDREDDHFVPPPAPPVPRVRARTVLAFLTLVLGMLVLFVPGLVQLPETNQVKVLGMALLGGGFAALVYWLHEAGPHDDDGAVV